MKKITLLFSFLIILSGALFSQGWTESPLTTNQVLVQKYTQLKATGAYRSGGSITDTLALDSIRGFLDDFSIDSPYPDTALWLNNYVFVNRDLPVAPVTIGAATFDGINANGYPYNFSAGMYTSGKADTLTSKPIDLAYTPADSIYFSFYYQPQGRGNYPDAADSLILEFKAAGLFSNQWKHVWAKRGPGTNLADSSWKLVMIRIADPMFLKKGFQFRFSNWATLSGNGDHWNIDYVYINKSRFVTDTIFKDISFVYNTPSLVNTYSVMPWRQYDPSFMKTSYREIMRNNSNIPTNGTFRYRIFDENNVQVDTTYTNGDFNFDPYSTTGYQNYAGFASPPLNYVIPALTAKTKYTIESYASAVGTVPNSNNKVVENDTVRHTQVFDNYFAYDDGTAEAAFGLAGALHAQMAVKYTMTVGDTLRCVDIFFNPQWTDASLYTFKLRLWNATSGGSPGSPLFSSVDSIYHPMYNQTGANKFTRYYLETPQYLPAGKTFFVGTEQNTTQLIAIGLDRNINSNDKIYYNSTGSWNHPPEPGSLMIHPVFGSMAEVAGIEEHKADNSMLIYPNPANDKLYIKLIAANPSPKMTYSILDIYGRTVMAGQSLTAEPIDLGGISSGVYFVRVSSENQVFTQKFIKAQ